MTQKRNFAQILNEKLDSPSVETSESSTFQGPTSEFLQSEISFYINPYSWKPKKIATTYKKKKRKIVTSSPIKKETPIILEPIEPSFKIEQFNDVERSQFQYLIKKGACINLEEITVSQLKREYRRILKLHHPDYSSSPDASTISQQIVNHYRNLHKKMVSLCNH